MGRRGLYSHFGSKKATQGDELAMLWVLNLADGQHSLPEVAECSGLAFANPVRVAQTLCTYGLLTEITDKEVVCAL